MEFVARQTAKLHGSNGIRCNIVIPGFTKTSAWDKIKDKFQGDKYLNKMVESTPL